MLYKFSLTTIHSKFLSIVFLILTLIFVAQAHLDLRNIPPSNNEKDKTHWLQPVELNAQYPQLISKNNWKLEFIKIEEIIKDLQFSSNKELLINSDTAEKLQLITAQFDINLENKEWGRLEFLITQSLGNTNGKTFYKLVNSYYHYRKEEVSFLDRIKQADNNRKLTLLKESKETYLHLQTHYFGSNIASTLFSRQNKTTNYLNARNIIRLEQGLSNEQKKERLSLLSKNYKQSLMQP